MMHAKKMMLITPETLEKLRAPQQVEHPMNILDTDMKDTLQRNDVNDQEKWVQFEQMMQKYLKAAQHMREPIQIPMVNISREIPLEQEILRSMGSNKTFIQKAERRCNNYKLYNLTQQYGVKKLKRLQMDVNKIQKPAKNSRISNVLQADGSNVRRLVQEIPNRGTTTKRRTDEDRVFDPLIWMQPPKRRRRERREGVAYTLRGRKRKPQEVSMAQLKRYKKENSFLSGLDVRSQRKRKAVVKDWWVDANLAVPPSFGTVEKLWIATGKKYNKLGIQEWLRSQDPNTLHKERRVNFSRSRYYVPSMNNLFQCGLCDMRNLSNENEVDPNTYANRKRKPADPVGYIDLEPELQEGTRGGFRVAWKLTRRDDSPIHSAAYELEDGHEIDGGTTSIASDACTIDEVSAPSNSTGQNIGLNLKSDGSNLEEEDVSIEAITTDAEYAESDSNVDSDDDSDSDALKSLAAKKEAACGRRGRIIVACFLTAMDGHGIFSLLTAQHQRLVADAAVPVPLSSRVRQAVFWDTSLHNSHGTQKHDMTHNYGDTIPSPNCRRLERRFLRRHLKQRFRPPWPFDIHVRRFLLIPNVHHLLIPAGVEDDVGLNKCTGVLQRADSSILSCCVTTEEFSLSSSFTSSLDLSTGS
ncbi:UNVERIFIED_CONTAM: hypothetical protein B566_EDAN017961, partial [Ephemera danica]